VNDWKVIFATAVIFGAGVVTGGLLVNYVDHPHARNIHRTAMAATNSVILTNNASQPKPARVPEILSKDFVEKLADTLQLTPEQRTAIDKIIADSQGQMRKAVQTVRQDARQKIRDQLTPDQQKQFDDLMKRPVRRQATTTNAPVVLPSPANSTAVAPTNAP
jgi:Spy/CpxP family protein refolding chaperone